MLLKFRFLFFFIFVFTIINPSYSQDELNPCLKAQAFHIVVIGSSTAAGAGPSVSDSAWVNRYRKFLQSINPANQVSNLAIGGTNTYNIMPTWFVPPPGRPLTNPNNNITQAIIINADAVIVNMPSNDAASGFTANEQLFNFHTIFNSADSFGIPVWTCTTQPRNFSASQIQIQLDVRDSVISAFGPMAIDFWTNLADTNNLPSSLYDSGDGVHLNDAGHKILFNRVKDKNILSQLFIQGTSADFAVIDFELSNTSICGDSMQELSAIIANIGMDSLISVAVEMQVTNLDSGTIQIYFDTIPNGLLACTTDTLEAIFNTFDGGTYQYDIFLSSSDSNAFNDTLRFIKHYSGHPAISALGDVICMSDTAFLVAFSNVGDTVLWYDSAISTNVIATGNQFSTSNVVSNTTYYSEAVRGDLFFKNSIFTRSQTNIAFNGYMYDLIADTSLTVDSLSVKFISTGGQIVEVYSKQGTHIGFELDTNAWSLLLRDTILVDSSGSFVAVTMNSLSLNPNDSMAFYVKLQNPSSNLAYQSVSNPISRSTQELTLYTGTGISNFFANSFYPRDLAFEVHYHHGFNATGDCSSGRVPVEVIVSVPEPNLGNDTAFCQQYYDITLYPGVFINYLWSNGATTSTVQLPSMYYPIGPNLFYVTVFDSIGCSASDSITVTYLLCSGLEEMESNNINIYPNPSMGKMHIEYYPNASLFDQVAVFDNSGHLVIKKPIHNHFIDLADLPSGNYFLHLFGSDFFGQKKIIIVE